MSEKTKRISQLQSRIPERWTPPSSELVSELTMLEVGLLCILTRHLSGTAADKTLKALRSAYPDWNELRVSQVQEYQPLIKTKSEDLQRTVAFDVKEFLRDVYQKNHGFDLEFLREDSGEAGKFILQLTHLGASAGHYLLWVASGGEVPVSTGMIRVLDRLGLMKRTSSTRKAQQTLSALVPEGERARFGTSFGLVVERWCDAKKPTCWECVLVEECRYGKKVFKDWKAQQVRLEQQRKREEERRKKEEERARKRAEAEEKKRLREEEKKRREKERKRKREEREREAAKKKAAAAKKKAAAKKAATAKKKAARKKVVKKKTAKKKARKTTKTASRTKSKTGKKKTNKKRVTRKPAKKKTSKRPATRKKPRAGKKKASRKKKTNRR